MNKNEKFELIRKQVEAGLLNPMEQFEAETRLACTPEREISSKIMDTDLCKKENVSFSRNGKLMLASKMHNENLCIYSIPSGKCLQVIKANKDGDQKHIVSNISPDGKYILSVGYNLNTIKDNDKVERNIIVWNTILGSVKSKFQIAAIDTLYKVDSTVDNQTIILLSLIKPFENKTKSISIYNFRTGNLLYRFGKYINDFVISPDGKYLYYSEKNKINKFDLFTRSVETIYISNKMVDELQLSNEGTTLVTLEGPKEQNRWLNTNNFRIVDLKNETSKALKTEMHHKGFSLHPSGDYIFSYDVDFKYLHGNMEWHNVWDISTEKIKDLGENLIFIRFPVFFTPDGKYLINMYNSKISFWDLEKKENCSLVDFTHKGLNQKDIFITNKSKYIVLGEKDSWPRQFYLDQIDLINGTVKKNIFDFHKLDNKKICINNDGDLVAFLPDEKTLEIWNIQENKKNFNCSITYASLLESIIFSEINNEKVIAYNDGFRIVIRKIKYGEVIHIFETKGLPKKIYFSKDKKTVFSKGYKNNTWFDLNLGMEIFNYEKPIKEGFFASDDIGAVVAGHVIGKVNKSYIDPENKTFYIAHTNIIEDLSSKENHQICLFDLKKDLLLKKFNGYKTEVIQISVDYESKTFISIHKDGEIRKWNIKTGECVQNFSIPKNIFFIFEIESIEITEDNKKLIITNSKGDIFFWDFQTGEMLVKALNIKNGYLWSTPPDEFAPNGWLHTNRPDLISLIESNKVDQGNPSFIPEDDQRFKDYMKMYNDQEMVMTRLNDFDRYQELLDIRLGNQKRTSEMLLKDHNPIKLLIDTTPIQNQKVGRNE